jgi:DNA (cytosine-5)-methyltransferase 1
MVKSTKTNKIYTAISIFSGAGGLDLGFESTGRVRVLETHDANEKFVETLLLNKGKSISPDFQYVLCDTDICNSDLGNQEFLDGFIEKKGKIDIVYGGPPCQSFSVAGKRLGLQDMRGSLIYSFLEIVGNISPKGFLFENVPGFRTIHGGELRHSFLKQLQKIGYSTWDGILNAADFGSATFRERYFIIGVKGNTSLRPPQRTHIDPKRVNDLQDDLFGVTLEPWATCEEPLAKVKIDASNTEIPNHIFVNHRPEVRERFGKLKFGERDQARRRNRLDPKRPSYTIFVGGELGKLQARTHIHPFENRELTPRECAAIHGFPNNWEFYGNLDDSLQQVANSVPVPLAKSVASYLINYLESKTQCF